MSTTTDNFKRRAKQRRWDITEQKIEALTLMVNAMSKLHVDRKQRSFQFYKLCEAVAITPDTSRLTPTLQKLKDYHNGQAA